MKGWFKLLVLATVPIIAVTMVVDQGLAADKGSQLIFIAEMGSDTQEYISITNTSVDIPDLDTVNNVDVDGDPDMPAVDGMAVTVLVQYHNDEVRSEGKNIDLPAYLRVLTGGETVLIDPFNHMIPGTERSVYDLLSDLPMMSTDDDPGINSGRFVITVTAVGANSAEDDRTLPMRQH